MMTWRARPDVANESAEPADFYSGAVRRILKFTLAIAAILVFPVLWRFGAAATAGFTVGVVISWFNFRSLRQGVDRLAGRIIDQHSTQGGGVIIFRFLLRYLLVAGCAYAIFISSRQAFEGFLFGVCLPVAGMLAEAAYETYMVFRRGY
jgi:hypothetical protein